MPSLNLSPLSILRSGRDFTLAGIPDLASEQPVEAPKAALGPSVNLIVRSTSAAVPPPRIRRPRCAAQRPPVTSGLPLHRRGSALTLTGTAPTEGQGRSRAAARAGWLNFNVCQQHHHQGRRCVAATTCRPAVDADLAAPIRFRPAATLCPPARTAALDRRLGGQGLPDAKLTVISHTNSASNDAINNPFSENRAKSVAAYLVAQNSRQDRSPTRGPVRRTGGNDDTETGRAKNHRTEIKGQLGSISMGFFWRSGCGTWQPSSPARPSPG